MRYWACLTFPEDLTPLQRHRKTTNQLSSRQPNSGHLIDPKCSRPLDLWRTLNLDTQVGRGRELMILKKGWEINKEINIKLYSDESWPYLLYRQTEMHHTPCTVHLNHFENVSECLMLLSQDRTILLTLLNSWRPIWFCVPVLTETNQWVGLPS